MNFGYFEDEHMIEFRRIKLWEIRKGNFTSSQQIKETVNG